MNAISYISIGSNIGNRIFNIDNSIVKLSAFSKILSQSSFYETQPWGYKDDINYINIVIKIQTDLSPYILLSKLKDVEKEMGRKKNINTYYTARIIDLDILFFNDLVICSDVLSIPHKELYNRNFVLEPLVEIDSNYKCPLTNKKASQLLLDCKDRSKVSLYKIIN